MGGFYYITKLGDMWDYIAWQVYGDEMMMPTLMEAQENKGLLDIYIFSQGTKVWCPYIDEESSDIDIPEWRDTE